MATDNTPWFIGIEGVEHSANVARTLAYAATGGVDGIIGPADLKVVAFPTPGNGVRVMPGACSLVNYFVGDSKESYVGRNPTYTNVTIDKTDSTGPRSDLVVATIRDPQFRSYSDWNQAKLNDYDYFRIEVIKGVSSTTKKLSSLTYPAYALARIDIPANTATITPAMITDLRSMTNMRTDRQVLIERPGSDLNMSKGASAYKAYPAGLKVQFKVPSWATSAIITTTYSGIEVLKSGTERQVAGFRGVLGTMTDTQNTILTGIPTQRLMHVNASQFGIPSSYRGLTIDFVCAAAHTQGNGLFQLDYQSTITYDAQFMEVPE